MPTFTFTSPDGKSYSVNGPDGATSEQAFQILQQHLGSPPPAQAQTTGGKLGAAITDIPGEIYNAAASAAGTIAGKFNPYSDANTARAERLKNASFLGGMGDVAGSVLDTGKAIASVPALAASPITGAGRSILGNTFDAIAPQFTPAQTAELAKSGVTLPTGKEAADLAMMAARPSGANPAGVVTRPGPVPLAADLKTAATGGYDAVKNSGIEIKPSSMQNFTAKVQADLNADGLNEVLAPRTFQVLDKLGNPQPGATVTPNDFRTLQRALGYAAKSVDPTERLAASRAMDALNTQIENLPASDLARGTPADAAQMSGTIKEANANYAAYKRAQEFDLRGQKAQNNAAAANSGMNLENNLRTQVRQILNSPKLQRGLDADTLEAFRKFNSGSRAANVLRMVGNALGGGGGWGTVANAALGSVLAGPAGAVAVPTAGMAMKLAGNARALREFDKLSEMIRANSPLARKAAPVPVSAPNPLLANIPVSQLQQLFPLRGLLGVMPAPADEQK